MKETFTVEEKLVVLDRQIITLKQLWADRLRRKEEYAIHHLEVMKSIAKDLRNAAGYQVLPSRGPVSGSAQ